MKISEYGRDSTFSTGDVLLKDGENGTRIISIEDVAKYILATNDVPEMHRNTFRGKYLGTSVTNAQKTAISNGTFDDLFIGDYWTMQGVNWVIADIDYWYNQGDTSAFTTHHLVIIPSENLYTAQMNDTATTAGGYVGSQMRLYNLASARETFQHAFGSMVRSHREFLINAVTSGHSSAGAWYDSTVDLMNEIMVYGTMIRAQANGPTGVTTTTNSKQQLSIFRLNPSALSKQAHVWLRDVVSASYFAAIYSYGSSASFSATTYAGVRPIAAIG